jgi:chromosome segregation ATPase
LSESDVRADIQHLKHDTADLHAGIAAGKALKGSLRDGKRRFDELQAQLAELEDEFHREEAQTRDAKRELADAQAALERGRADAEDEVARTDSQIRDLTERIRRQESLEREALSRAQKRRAAAQEQKVATFVIDGRVKVRPEELQGLRNMVAAIQRENRELAEDVDSKQADIDCLMQENRGLYQLIRQFADTNEQGRKRTGDH